MTALLVIKKYIYIYIYKDDSKISILASYFARAPTKNLLDSDDYSVANRENHGT